MTFYLIIREKSTYFCLSAFCLLVCFECRLFSLTFSLYQSGVEVAVVEEGVDTTAGTTATSATCRTTITVNLSGQLKLYVTLHVNVTAATTARVTVLKRWQVIMVTVFSGKIIAQKF